MRKLLLATVVPGFLLAGAGCSMLDKAKSTVSGGPAPSSSSSSSSPVAAATSAVASDSSPVASVAPAAATEAPAARGGKLPPPDPTKNVVGAPFPAPSDKAQVMDETGDRDPFIWISTKYENETVVWTPKVQVIVRMASARKDDVLEIQHMEGKKKWGPAQKCMPNGEPWKTDNTSLIKFDCQADDSAVNSKNAGEFSAVLSYIQTAAGKRQDAFATLKYNVLKFRADTKPKNPDMKFVVDYDFHIGDAWMYPQIQGSNIHPDYQHDPTAPLDAVMFTWLKWQKQEPSDPVMRCYLNGKEVAETTGGSMGGGEYESYKDAKSDIVKIGWSKYRFHFGKLVYAKPLDPDSRGNYNGLFAMNENPGDYTCKITHQGDVIRVINFSFKGNDVVRSPCEKDLVTFSPTSLLTVTEKKGDAPFAADAFKKNAFFGRVAWPAGCPK